MCIRDRFYSFAQQSHKKLILMAAGQGRPACCLLYTSRIRHMDRKSPKPHRRKGSGAGTEYPRTAQTAALIFSKSYPSPVHSVSSRIRSARQENRCLLYTSSSQHATIRPWQPPVAEMEHPVGGPADVYKRQSRATAWYLKTAACAAALPLAARAYSAHCWRKKAWFSCRTAA